ncbi:sialidase family protein [Sphingomonas sp. SUN039]|uniref:sialidase family protein n=1 Tax=Sphingomonas sp. SUN039 TaxID=2937787 RepID=UPI002164E5A7|nr:sialidase family protein [Sphingomonas sp. SUN039]UVO53678.1 glycoside hydrolase [Sphingomonas sp. SUN039]
MPDAAQRRGGAPVMLGLAGIAALLAAFVVPAVLQNKPDWPVFSPLETGCHADRRTVRHSGGAVTGSGIYEPCLADTSMASGEPGLAITRDGTLLRSVVTGPAGIAVSSDDGASWTRRPLPPGTRDGIPDGYLDPVTDRFFYSALGDTPVFASDDKGITWHKGTFDSSERYDWNRVFSGVPVLPRTSGYPTNIYYCNMTQPGGFVTGARCFKSVDGGRNFKATGTDPFKQGDCRDVTQPKGSGTGRGIVDPRDGTIYLPVHFCGYVEVAISRDEGKSWTHRPVARLESAKGVLMALASPAWRKQIMSGRPNAVPAEMAESQFSDALAIDGAGRLYLVWNDEAYLPVLSWSGNKGLNWSQPVRLNPPGVVQSVLTAVTVTPEGKLGVSYYGSTDRQSWTGYLAVSDDPTASRPTFETASVTRAGRPLMPEACCWASGPQEYTIARWAPDGSLWGAFVATVPKGNARGVLGRLVRR